MKDNWLWDRKITDSEAKKALKKPGTGAFFTMAALLLSRKNEPNEVFKNYIDPVIFCKNWAGIKRKMRQDKWSEPRIIFWQAIYEKLADRYRKEGVVFRQAAPAKEPFCEVIGKKIAAIRREQGLSQKKLAKKIGVSQQLISRIEKGGENISLITLTNIARSLNKAVEINFPNSQLSIPH
ncbi:MAG: helix-turn-helix transcriptional regulator [Candidatus Omnitrophica bacterium]|nr:helix-turn-helix transcriptional regulator [Candidatus Omnitrophota bacterium]